MKTRMERRDFLTNTLFAGAGSVGFINESLAGTPNDIKPLKPFYVPPIAEPLLPG